jgi:NitT/TauT family transport system substrate-binding protein
MFAPSPISYRRETSMRIETTHAARPAIVAAFIVSFVLSPLGVATAETPVTVKIGTPNVASDAPLFIAVEKGYFAKEGIVPEFVSFPSASQMIVPLAAGQIDVGAGGVSAGLYNAVARGLKIRAVADKVRLRRGSRYIDLVIRKDLVDSGRFTGAKDLKGLSIAEGGRETTTVPALSMAAKSGGLSYDDFSHPVMPFADQVTALANHSIDGAVTVEPNITKIIDGGIGAIVTSINDIAPDMQIAVLLYSEHFAQDREPAQRFLNAYLEGTRYYADAIVNGRLAGPHAADVISILTKYTNLKDAALYQKIAPSELDPDGRINTESLNDSLHFFQARNIVQGNFDIGSLVDSSFATAAVSKLGPYKPGGR